MTTRIRGRRRTAFTLIEAVISLLLVSVLLIPSLELLRISTRTVRTAGREQARCALAGELLSEILVLPFEDPDPDRVFGVEPSESAASRAGFDDIDDYGGWLESPPADADGAPHAGYAGWSRSVTVTRADPADPQQDSATDSGRVRIVVAVTDADGHETTRAALRTRSGVYEHEPRLDSEYVTGVTLRVRIGSAGAPALSTRTHLLNRVPPAAAP